MDLMEWIAAVILFMIAVLCPACELCPAHGFSFQAPPAPIIQPRPSDSANDSLILCTCGTCGTWDKPFRLQPCLWRALLISCYFGNDFDLYGRLA